MLTLICSAPFLQHGDQQRGQEQALCTQKGLHFPEFLNASLNLIQIMCGTDRNAPLLDSGEVVTLLSRVFRIIARSFSDFELEVPVSKYTNGVICSLFFLATNHYMHLRIMSKPQQRLVLFSKCLQYAIN